MSDTEAKDTGKSSSNVGVCHAFLRNACKHGANCKFKHPEGLEGKRSYSFCHDYQNTECRRINCKFLHCTRQEEQHYRVTGELPKQVLNSLDARKNSDSYSGNDQMPVCKDYLKGDCRRGSSCRYRHVNGSDYDSNPPRRGSGAAGPRDDYQSYDRYDKYNTFEPELKRRAFEDPFAQISDGAPDPSSRMPPEYNEYYILEEENYYMRRRVEELKKQILELTATNEFLLDQNAQLRFAKQSPVSPVSQSLNSMNAMNAMSQLAMGSNDLAAQCMTPPELSMSMGVPASLGQGMGHNYPYSQMQVNAQGNNLVSYPVLTQRLRPVMP